MGSPSGVPVPCISNVSMSAGRNPASSSARRTTCRRHLTASERYRISLLHGVQIAIAGVCISAGRIVSSSARRLTCIKPHILSEPYIVACIQGIQFD